VEGAICALSGTPKKPRQNKVKRSGQVILRFVVLNKRSTKLIPNRAYRIYSSKCRGAL